MQKRILIKAYVNLNLGDDLFIKILCERYPEHHFYLICSQAKAVSFKNINNLTIIKPIRYIDSALHKLNIDFRFNNLYEKHFTKKIDATINIGGSIFIEKNKDWVKEANYYESLVDNSKHFFVLGCNFGPYKDVSFLKRYQDIFNKIDDICFRDVYSYSKFSDLENTRIAPDIVFSLDTNKVKKINMENYVVISIIDLSWRRDLKKYTHEYEMSILNISKKLIKQGKKVVLMSFCGPQGDEDVIQRIMQTISNHNITSHFYNGNLEESLSLIKSSDGVIATRFHSLILGWLFNKPVFPFVYSDKTQNLLDDTKYDGYSIPISEINSININEVVKQLTQSRPQNITMECEKSHSHFMKTDKLLKNGKIL